MKRPNILFLLADDMGCWAMKNAGNTDIQTPCLDALAERGVKFNQFFCASPVCSPARASILTGTMPSCHGILDWLDGGSLDRSVLTRDMLAYLPHETVPIPYTEHLTGYTDLLAQNGYRCALAGKWHMGDSMTPQHGFTDWFTIGGGGVPYFNPQVIENGELKQKKGYITDLIADYAIDRLEAFVRQDAPFYLSVHFTAPHSPWEETDHKQEFLDLYRNCTFTATPDLPFHPWQVDTCPHGRGERRKELLRGYYAAISSMDQQIGRILDRLGTLGLADNTIIFFTSDNGMNLGQHGIWGKGNGTFPQNMYDTSIKVPFIASWPGHFAEGRVCSELFSHYDILPTICQLAGCTPRTTQKLPGSSFVPWLERPELQSENSIVVFDEYGPVRMIRDKEWKLVLRYPYGPNKFYHLSEDPDETRNLFCDPVYEDRILDMRRRLEEWFLQYSDPDLDARKEGVTGTGQRCRPGTGAHLLQKYGPVPKPVREKVFDPDAD